MLFVCFLDRFVFVFVCCLFPAKLACRSMFVFVLFVVGVCLLFVFVCCVCLLFVFIVCVCCLCLFVGVSMNKVAGAAEGGSNTVLVGTWSSKRPKKNIAVCCWFVVCFVVNGIVVCLL